MEVTERGDKVVSWGGGSRSFIGALVKPNGTTTNS